MLLNINPAADSMQRINGQAHIVVCLDKRGEIDGAYAFVNGRLDSACHVKDGGRLLNRVMPLLLRELRVQLASQDDGAESGSKVTE